MSASDTLAIIICFNPDHDRLRKLLLAIEGALSKIILFDNGGLNHDAVAGFSRDVEISTLGGNVGLGSALNFGCEVGVREGYRFIISFDQDSDPSSEMILNLRKELVAYQERNARAIAIGPLLVERRGEREEVLPFVRFGKYGVSKWSGEGTEVVSQLITSGCLIDLHLWRDADRFNEDLFIDCVDNNWCWHAVRSGYFLLGTSHAIMPHEISEGIKKFGSLSMNRYSVTRRYFQVRNSLYHFFYEPLSLAQRIYLLRAMGVAIVSSIFSDRYPLQSAWQCLRGAGHGFVGKLGPYKR